MRLVGFYTAFISLLLTICLGCSSARLIGDVSQLNDTTLRYVNSHEERLKAETSAQLVQVTIRSSKLTRRFNLEMYHRESESTFYTGGFAGRGSFKGLLKGDWLSFILPREKQYYDGPVSGLIQPDLSRYEYVVIRLRQLLAGDLFCDDSDGVSGDVCDSWEQNLYVAGENLKKVVSNSNSDPIRIEAEFFKFKGGFPYYQLRRVKIVNSESGAQIKLKFIEQRFGPVPDVKLSLPNYTGWERIDYFEIE